jgi:hypothetical protein
MPAPTLEEVTASLGDDVTATPETIAEAYAEEVAAQAAVCRTLTEDEIATYPANLAGALRRRVAVNIAFRALPLAAAATLPDPATPTGVAADPEVRRLEGPYRRVIFG